GNDTLTNVTLNDSLLGKTIKSPATYNMHTYPVSTDNHLMANPSFNGGTDIRLIIPEQSKMPPNTVASVYFAIDVVPGSVTSIANSAYGHASARISDTEFTIVSDTSNTGSNPDSNNNGVWNEWADNVPTMLEIPNTNTLFIPEGFSPNGDNINDVFHITGLPTEGQNSLIIFNRWGNKVYSSSDYDNLWDGTPNVGVTLGKSKLPQGTYYYILDMKGSGSKPITGFVVLQY
ncbi:MAG: gliding motility-associated C-terminal domain-containing protein, partial [Bacteroidia bacterium]|nr:gliding motility-associated C-terminal domain-containing protein [Bacteroidia bacterium]